MALFHSKGIGIAGIACAVPDNEVTVDSFIPVFGEEVPAKFTAGTGIKSMYKALPDQTAGDLAYAAAEELLSHIKIDRQQIGTLLFVTQSPDYRRPATACVLQKRLGLSIECAAMDIGLGCSGFVYGLQTAMSMMQNSDINYCLLLLGETASKLVHPLDKSIVMMYGDAGAAVLLEKRPGAESTTLLRSDGNRFKTIILPAGGFRDMNPSHERFMCNDGIERSLYDIYMEGTSVFSFSISDVPRAVQDYLDKTSTKVDDYDLFLFHQANQFIIKQLSKRLKLPKAKVPISLDRYGNTGGISIPLTLCLNNGETNLGRKKIFMVGFGIGLSWGISSAEIDTAKVYPIIKTRNWYKDGKISPEMLK